MLKPFYLSTSGRQLIAEALKFYWLHGGLEPGHLEPMAQLATLFEDEAACAISIVQHVQAIDGEVIGSPRP